MGNRDEDSKAENRISNKFVSELSILSGHPKNVVIDIYCAILVYMQRHLKLEEKCNLKNLGIFTVKTHKGHPVIKNLKESADAIETIDDYMIIKFKPHNYLKNLVFGKDEDAEGEIIE